MSEPVKVNIAINVMRARLTVVGFNIAVVSFQLSEIMRFSGGVSVPGFSHTIHFRADIALFISLALSLMSLIVFISSSASDSEGRCDHWLFMLGDIFMYAALSNTVTGFFSPLNETFLSIARQLPAQSAQVLLFSTVVFYFGCITWGAATYFGPCITLIRSPFSRRITITLGGTYLLLLQLTHWINYQVLLFEAENIGEITPQIPFHFLLAFIQPALW